jgi:hypothetical protein
MYKKYAYQLQSGTEALTKALEHLKSKRVIIPTYTCTDILAAVWLAGCEAIIVDCNKDLQISPEEVTLKASDADTVIVPHMFGIRASVEMIRNTTDLKIIEDLSQCHGLPNLGANADVVVTSTNKSKWLDFNGGGVLFLDEQVDLPPADIKHWPELIEKKFNRRVELAQELKNAGVKLIGQESAWLRGMYYTEQSKREPYTPLHKITDGVDCPEVNSYIGKIDWVSIIV